MFREEIVEKIEKCIEEIERIQFNMNDQFNAGASFSRDMCLIKLEALLDFCNSYTVDKE